MKRYMTYEEMTDLIDSKMDAIRAGEFDCIVAVVRGGLTAAHYISKELRLPLGVYYPPTDDYDSILVVRDEPKRILFVEDLVAKGRTYDTIVEAMDSIHLLSVDWDFFPLVVDAEYDKVSFQYEGIKTDEWIVFPYEDMDKMTEGDRGFFRNNTDSYGKE